MEVMKRRQRSDHQVAMEAMIEVLVEVMIEVLVKLRRNHRWSHWN